MTSKEKKTYIIAGVIGVVTIAGAVAYVQYKKLMNYSLTFRSIKINKVSLSIFDFNLFFNLQNRAAISYTIDKQSYDVYINNVFVIRLENTASTPIAANAVSPLGLNVKFNPKQALEKLGYNLTTILKNNDKLIIKIDMKFRFKVWGIPFNFPYVYEDSLKNMMGV